MAVLLTLKCKSVRKLRIMKDLDFFNKLSTYGYFCFRFLATQVILVSLVCVIFFKWRDESCTVSTLIIAVLKLISVRENRKLMLNI